MTSLSSANDPVEMRTLVVTETGTPTSFDPLDADGWQNMSVMRMLYATPIIVSADSSLSSQILESFKYDPAEKKMSWQIKSGIKFSDGSPITADDIAFAVARFAYVRPNFPVIDSIAGLDKWKTLAKNLALTTFPQGIIVNGNKIEIQFTRKVKHPFFRFSLEVFSVIPRKSVELKTNQINSKIPPFSGTFALQKQDDASILFQLRKNSGLAQLEKIPELIRFEYRQPDKVESIADSLDKNTVISGNELHYKTATLQKLSTRAEIRYLQSTWFALFVLNPEDALFKVEACRTWFSKQFKNTLEELYGDSINRESSIFPKLLPGYLTSRQLEKSDLTDKEAKDCLSLLQSQGFRWAKVKNAPTGIFQETLTKLFENLGIENKAKILESREEQGELFSKGKLSIFEGFTGFWAQDPAGDLKMLFTPKMHPPLRYLAEDKKLQQLIQAVYETESQEDYLAVNKYIASGSVFNVFMHTRRFYIAKKGNQTLDHTPMSMGSIVPWQIFISQ
jgi:ABC-type transport system substrate-binding protein